MCGMMIGGGVEGMIAQHSECFFFLRPWRLEGRGKTLKTGKKCVGSETRTASR